MKTYTFTIEEVCEKKMVVDADDESGAIKKVLETVDEQDGWSVKSKNVKDVRIIEKQDNF